MLLIPLKRRKLLIKPPALIRLLPLLLFLLLNNYSIAQQDSISQKKYSLGLTAVLPVGNFSSSHFAGAGMSFGRIIIQQRLLGIKRLGLHSELGANYYFGKKVTVSGYEYRYPTYLQVYLFPGFIYRYKRSVPSLHVGAGTTRYKSDWRFSWFGKAEYQHRLNENFCVGAGLFTQKQKKADLLWSAFLKGYYNF